MIKVHMYFFLSVFLVFSTIAYADVPKNSTFKKIFIVIFENSEADKTLEQPTFKALANQGAYLNDFRAITHPSQPNYIAMTSGSTHGIKDDKPYIINAENIVDLLEKKNISWKVYAEDYPGNCDPVEKIGKYARNHNPFISYKNIRDNPKRCAKIVKGSELAKDIKSNNLPDFSFYIPNIDDNGHNTSVTYADHWLKTTMVPLLNDPKFMHDMLFIITFDEGDNKHPTPENKIYTLFYGNMVKKKTINHEYNFYNMLRTIEDEWKLGTLKQHDITHAPIEGIWR